MKLTFPINLIGHDAWLASSYALDKSQGDVLCRHGEVLGSWRVVDYDPEAENSNGRYEFIARGTSGVTFSEEFAHVDVRVSRGFALINLTQDIQEWHEAGLNQPTLRSR